MDKNLLHGFFNACFGSVNIFAYQSFTEIGQVVAVLLSSTAALLSVIVALKKLKRNK